ncbi:serine hydrolase [Frankia sp. QA3]|uniref:serine hydrolase domain-containing protein n=1 Tax=Frankia sp. QA3 TaxID=710111 RepID=UPI000269C182|nr:serine hydrolase domain-containing protein [Frankia sp. QA3]EIV92094.1 penicillin-binding protein, beta-lactamase class C [Frankia sp. QA3]
MTWPAFHAFVTDPWRRSSDLRGPHRAHRPKPAGRVLPVGAFRAIVAIIVVVSPLLAGAAPALAGTPAPRVGEPDTARIDPELRTLLSDVTAAGVPGILVRVQDQRGSGQAAAGVADLATGAPLQPQARVRVGSITKTFVATVVLQLVEEGRLGLDRPVGRWLPGLLRGGDTITVRQLLNHTSGLFDYTADPALLSGIVHNRVFDPKELVATAETHPSSFPPGTAWEYSNTNYIVAGLLVESITRRPLGEELQRRIFRPLGLTDTSLPTTTGNLRGYHAHGYVPADLAPTPDGRPFDVTGLNPSHAWASGAVVSSARDLAHFYRSLLGGKVLSARMLREMTTTTVETPGDPKVRYGLGIERVQDRCGANWGHSGAIFGYQSMAFWNEDTTRTVVLASTIHPAPAPAGTALATAADHALCGTPRPRNP